MLTKYITDTDIPPPSPKREASGVATGLVKITGAFAQGIVVYCTPSASPAATLAVQTLLHPPVLSRVAG